MGKTRDELLEDLARRRGDVAIRVLWSPDPDPEPWYPEWGDQGDIECLTVEVRAITLRNGHRVTGSAYLGRCWYPPYAPCENIGGYFPQMLEEALEELDEALAGVPSNEFKAGDEPAVRQRLTAHQRGADDAFDGETMDASRWFNDPEARSEYERGYKANEQSHRQEEG